jgi:hypothetical protein
LNPKQYNKAIPTQTSGVLVTSELAQHILGDIIKNVGGWCAETANGTITENRDDIRRRLKKLLFTFSGWVVLWMRMCPMRLLIRQCRRPAYSTKTRRRHTVQNTLTQL